jgi:NAD(P)-dependent dehydrogenase (short-subunit alcohol dehydrogenase family)
LIRLDNKVTLITGAAVAGMRQLRSFHPLDRIGKPRDVADVALFLASDAASFISGTFLVVDGAMTAAGH